MSHPLSHWQPSCAASWTAIPSGSCRAMLKRGTWTWCSPWWVAPAPGQGVDVGVGCAGEALTGPGQMLLAPTCSSSFTPLPVCRYGSLLVLQQAILRHLGRKHSECAVLLCCQQQPDVRRACAGYHSAAVCDASLLPCIHTCPPASPLQTCMGLTLLRLPPLTWCWRQLRTCAQSSR